jgi:starch-binding outer membrane protein, SusD/RagB family
MKILKYSLILSFALLVSCKEDFLNQDLNSSNIQSGTYYNTVSEVESATNAQYPFIDYDDWWQTQWFRSIDEAASDNAWIGVNGGQGTAVQAAHYTLNGENDRIEAHWIMIYKSIYRFNATIEGIEKSNVDATVKARSISELKFLRAYQYFDLVKHWGAVPLITQTLPPSGNSYKRSTPKEIYDFLKNDLKAAIEVLPTKSAYSAVNKFKISKGAAAALLAKISLFSEDWAGAIAAADQVISSGDYSLEPAFADVFRTTNYNGRESIFETQFQFNTVLPNLGNIFPTTSMSPAESGWGYFTPTSDLENAFKAQGDSIRLNWTIMRHGFPSIGETTNIIFDGRPANTKSARFNRKIYVLRSERTTARFSKNRIHIRLADIYLVKAEAAAMLNQIATALSALKVIRDRVSLKTDNTLTGQALIDAVRLERRLELAMEGDRLFDLRRWKDASGNPVINSVMGPNGSFVVYNTKLSKDRFELGNLNEPQNKGANFLAGKHNLWPIPTKEIIAGEGRIDQNPGY